MSGILDSKSRMIDAILTSEGRRQMAEGTFEVSYVTFTDADVAYEAHSVTGHVDPTNRIYFEASNLPQDQITFEANDEGKLLPLRMQNISVKSPDMFLGTTSQATLTDGRLVAYQFYNGRRIKVSSILENPNDKNKGFVYADDLAVTASVLINPDLKAGLISSSVPPGGPYFSYIGTKGGLTEREFAIAISGAIGKITDGSGPQVFTTVAEDSVYLDLGKNFSDNLLFATGTLSSPLQIEGSAIGNKLNTSEVESAAFASQIRGILTSSIDNFVELQTIPSVDRLFEDQDFFLSINEISFDVEDIQNNVTKLSANSPPTVNEIDSLFTDDKLSHVDNFLYLPPIIKTSNTVAPDKSDIKNLITRNRLLGNYPSWGDNESKLSYKGIKTQLSNFGLGREVLLEKSSRNNHIIGQFFEVTGQTVSKLDVVDFGEVYNEDKKTQEKVFFVGKVFLDNRGTACFVNMFTLVFSNEEGGM